jgi:hypothetical protein
MKRLILLTLGITVILALGVALFVGYLRATALVNAQEGVEIPFLDEWSGSGHADAAAEPFVHWNEEDPKEVPVECAKCHSTPGYRDFIGADGSAAGVVDQAAPIGTVVECAACHNDVTLTMDSVVMPSGVEITGLGREARCMQCHQGRESTVSVNEAITEAGVADEDTISEEFGFLNIHYYAAAATKYGTVAKGGYEYEGKTYDANFAHVEQFDTCVECHNPHTLEVRVEQCSECHTGVTSVDDLKNVRMPGSLVDYDGDGDVEEGIYFEIEGLRELLLQGMQMYAEEVAGTAIAYDTVTYPYFFIDTNADGQSSTDEAIFENRFNAWTSRLLKAAYNYQVSSKDPGMFAHGGKYIIELLYDSIEDLNTAVANPIDLSKANRVDDGHFAGSEEPFRHWDADGEVPATCSKCHSAQGLPLFLKDQATISQPLSNGFQCTTCHNDLQTFTRYEVAEVEFPSGAVIDSGDPNMNLCMNCHQGRESTVSVNRLVQDLDEDTVSEDLRFLNIHYFAAGATRFGTEAKGAYEYDGKEYIGLFDHVNDADSCTECHSAHGLDVQVQVCADCHEGVETVEDLRTIRESEDDFDGDGDTTEGLAGEIDTMREALYAAIQDYGADIAGAAIVYNPASHPYFFIDANGNGQADPEEASSDGRYITWTPRLLKAAYNYQYSTKDPGAFAHNGLYILQTLYDSLEDIGTQVSVDMTGMTRPD